MRGADDRALGGERRRGCEPLGHAEVGQADHALGLLEQDVLGLDIAMNHAPAMGVAKRLGQFGENADRLGRLEPALALDARGEGLAFDVAHDEVHESVVLAKGEEGDDVRMGQLRRGACLAAKTLTKVGRLGAFGRKDLDRDEAVERGFTREVHRAHAPAAEQAFNKERIVDGGLEAILEGVRGAGVRPDPAPAARAEPGVRGHGSRAGRTGQGEELQSKTECRSGPRGRQR